MKTLNTRWKLVTLVPLRGLTLYGGTKMRLAENTTVQSHQLRSRWIAGIALFLLCAIPQITNAQSKKKMPVDILVTEMDIQSLSDKLEIFERQLSREELGAMNLLLR